MSKKFYIEDDFISIEASKTIRDLGEIAIKIIERVPAPISQVCGPISSGGRGSVEENLKHFGHAIKYLEESGKNVWSQMPFEKKIEKFWIDWKKNPSGDYMHEILDDFYLPIFESRKISELWFIPGWESSHGSNWERKQGERLGIKIFDLPEDFSQNIL